jgi:hypothetical protein
MFAFIDESGNTGPNMFDPDQPVFYSVAAISRKDLDIEYAPAFTRLAHENGFQTLHANVMGIRILENVIPEIQRMVKRDNVRFFLGRINKRDLVLTKLADTILDPSENRAVAWQVYNIKMLRLLNVIKLSAIAKEDTLRLFWEACMESSPNRAKERFVNGLNQALANLHELPDARSREILGDAIRWAVANPDAISVHAQKSARLSHLPHLVIFPTLLQAVQHQSDYWHIPVQEVRHHRESLVIKAIQNWHQLISNAPVETLQWVDSSIPIGGAPGSTFKEVTSDQSSGVQLADLVLWLVQRDAEGGSIGSAGQDLLKRVRRNAEQPYELSLSAIEDQLRPVFQHIMTLPMSVQQLAQGKSMVTEFETDRKGKVEAYKKADD